MKILLTLIMVLTFTLTAFADTVYIKEDDYTLKSTTTSENIEVVSYSMGELLTLKVRKLEEIKSNYDNYFSRDAQLKKELKNIESKISEAVKLGIKEMPDAL